MCKPCEEIAVPAQTVRRIAATDPATFAFEIDGEVTAAEMEGMADVMNAAFDTHDTVNMLLIFRRYEGSEAAAGFDWSSIRSRFRALAKVDKYVTVGAPDAAETMIETMATVMPIEARTFDLDEIDAAWAYVGARPA